MYVQYPECRLSSDNASATVPFVLNGRTLHVEVSVVDGAFVVFLDTPDWEPTPDLLRVNVNDGAIWNYPDYNTPMYGDMPEDQ